MGILPGDAAGLTRLARRLDLGGEGRDPLEEFQALYARHTGATRTILLRLFHHLFLARDRDLAALSDFVLDPEPHREAAVSSLAAHGLREPEQAAESLRRLGEDRNPRSRKFLASLAPHLVLHVGGTPEPDRCLRNLERVVGAYGAAATFFQLLSENEDMLAVFTDLCGWSQFLADLLVRNPAMIDAFADSLAVVQRDGRQPWDDLPLAEIETAESPEQVLGDFVDLSLLRIGVRDIQHKANTQNTARDLTQLAERVIRSAFEVVRSRAKARREPSPRSRRGRLAVIALGKLGAREMSYASDLDLFFVGDGADAEHLTSLARDLLRLLGEPGPCGRIYRVDARTRPGGRSGPLVTPLAGLESYYRESARVAEHQMLSKARPVAGDPDLGREVSEVIERVLFGSPPFENIRREVLDMRRRLEEESRGRDVKRGFGGIVDIEFLAEALKLLHGHRFPSLRAVDTLSVLGAARREDLLTAREHEALLTALQFLRSVESRMRIVYDMSQTRIPDTRSERDRLARRLGYSDAGPIPPGQALMEEYDYHTSRTREVFQAVLNR